MRTPHRRASCWGVLVVFVGCLAACSSSSTAGKGRTGAEPGAGTWKTWVLSSASEIVVPPPPADGSRQARAELTEVRDMASKRTAAQLAAAHRWGDYPLTEPWTKLNMELVSEESKNPPLASRGYGLMSVAIYDAVVSAWHWKYVYNRDPPSGTASVFPGGADPSYPDEQAVVAGAASRVLAYLFPERTDASYDQMAEDAAEARLAAGGAVRSDTQAGLSLGRSVADRVLARARADGSDASWDGVRPTATGTWEPPPGSPPGQTQPVEPRAGSWRSWVIDAPALRAAPPPIYGSPEFVAEAAQVRDIGDNLTDDQKRIATFWAGGRGTPLPPGIWNQIALDEVKRHRFSTPQVARAFALLNAAEADAGVAAWDTKYAYWSARPVNAIHDLGLDPDWEPFLPTPIFPSYISGHSTYSAAAAEVLAYVFPSQAQRFRDMAKEAGMSRVYGGIHYLSDNLAGLAVGTQVGRQIVDRVRADGGGEGGGPIVTRAADTLATGVGIPDPRLATPPSDRRSQPYWVPVTSLSGIGSQSSVPFRIRDEALQWRATWHCDAGPFAAVVWRNGKELRRKLIDATCPREGKDYSAEIGPLHLNVRATGSWRVDIEQQVDAPLLEPPPPELESAQLLGVAQMYDVDQEGEGTAKIYQFADGTRILRLNRFFVTMNSELELRLSGLTEPHSTDEIVAATPGIVTVAPLKATVGDMNYRLPANLDLAEYHSIVIWCEITRNAYAAASIQPP